MLEICAKPGVAVSLGFKGEQEVRRILFDISQLGRLCGEGKAMLIVQRCGEKVLYPVETRQDEKYLIRTVSARGERGTAYIGRYKIVNNRYQTLAGDNPHIGFTTSGDPRSTFRNGIHTYQSEGFHMQDWDAFWENHMLHLAEFADWHSKSVIGPDCAAGSSYPCVNGLTADMAYHTGSVSKGSVSYRQNLWTNGMEFADGIRKESRTMCETTDDDTGNDGTMSTRVMYLL